jgi:hypothetical protein
VRRSSLGLAYRATNMFRTARCDASGASQRYEPSGDGWRWPSEATGRPRRDLRLAGWNETKHGRPSRATLGAEMANRWSFVQHDSEAAIEKEMTSNKNCLVTASASRRQYNTAAPPIAN